MIAACKIFGAIFLTYFFMFVLMTASAQMRVAQTLADQQPKLDYSSAYARLLDAEDQMTALQARQVKLQAELDSQQTEAEAARFPYLDAAEPLRMVVLEVNQETKCNLATHWRRAEELATILGMLRYCGRLSGIDSDTRQEVQRILASPGSIITPARRWDVAERRIDRANSGLEEVKTERDALLKQTEGIRDAFAEMSVLRKSWVFCDGFLVQLPPSLMQILLALVSGLFGGLLLTLILIVFPNTGVELQSGGKEFVNRIMLGGLISVAVFIMIGSGTAVLGTSSALTDGKANLLSFSAVGVLAGMFSDRVTGWLSDRANALMSRSDRGETTVAVAAVAVSRPAAPKPAMPKRKPQHDRLPAIENI